MARSTQINFPDDGPPATPCAELSELSGQYRHRLWTLPRAEHHHLPLPLNLKRRTNLNFEEESPPSPSPPDIMAKLQHALGPDEAGDSDGNGEGSGGGQRGRRDDEHQQGETQMNEEGVGQ